MSQKKLEAKTLDRNFIQGRIAMYDILKSEKLGKEIEETSLTLRQLSTEFAALSNHLAHDSRHTADLRSRFEQSLRDGVKAVHIVDAFRAPAVTQPGGLPSQNVRPHPTFLQEFVISLAQFWNMLIGSFFARFFRRKVEELTNRLAVYKMSIDQVQAQLSRSDPDQVKGMPEACIIQPNTRASLRMFFVTLSYSSYFKGAAFSHVTTGKQAVHARK